MKSKMIVFALLSIFICHAQETKVWSIQECVAYAIENNISLQQQKLNANLSEEDIKAAKGNFYPDLGLVATQSWDFGSSIGNSGLRTNSDRRGNYFGLNSEVMLFNGLQNKKTLSERKLGLQSNNYQFDILKDDITIQILGGYIDILAKKENLRVAKEQVTITEKQIEQVEEFVTAGVRAKADLLEVKAQLARDQELVVQTESDLTMSKVNLTEILQISYKNFDVKDVDLDISSVSLLYSDAEEIYNKAVENRAEILKAQTDIERSDLNVDIAKGNYYPSLSFGAGYNTRYQHFQGIEDNSSDLLSPDEFSDQLNDNLNLNAVFRLNIPIFNRTHTKVNVQKNKINYLQAENNLAQEKQDLLSDVVRVYNNAKTSLNEYKASEASVDAQNEAFKNAQESFNLGVMTSFEFEQVRIRLVNAQSGFINAKYNFIFRTKALEYYTGIPITIN